MMPHLVLIVVCAAGANLVYSKKFIKDEKDFIKQLYYSALMANVRATIRTFVKSNKSFSVLFGILFRR